MTKLSSEKTFPGLPTRTSQRRLWVKTPKVSSWQELPAFLFIQTLVDKTAAEKKEEKDKAVKADDPKAGADVGKIVNLMAGDANRVYHLFFSVAVF